MGILMSKCCESTTTPTFQLKARIQALEEEIKSLHALRERELWGHEEQEKQWRKERSKHKEEIERLRKKVKEEEERIRSLEDWVGGYHCSLVDHMKEERQDAVVEKWKQLYLTIKSELDDLILRTTQGARFGFGGEDGLIDRLQTELIVKDEAVEALSSRLYLMENEGAKREREIDILRQSLRILNNTTTKKRNGMRRNLRRRWLV